ncbi:MAG: tight adherence protein [Frankiales bacterium]|jgi:tight adherence protein C|nr:tight adherence protein [Frankiales bacterium]
MADQQLLMAGLGALFAATMLTLTAAGFLAPGRRAVTRSIAVVDRMRIGAVSTATVQDRSFRDRIAQPSLTGLVALARKLSSRGVVERLQHRLDLAGNSPGWTVDRLLGVKGLGLVILGALGLLMGKSSYATGIVFGVVLGTAGFFLPNVLLYNSGLKRQLVIRKSLPDAMDLLVISVEAGLGFDAAVAQVAKNTDGPLAGEFFRLMQEMQIGKSRGEAFRALADRSDVDELRGFTQSVIQADALGVPIARVLHEQAGDMRIKRRQRAEEQAQKVPVKILFPLVVFILPTLFIVVLGPGALSIARVFSH